MNLEIALLVLVIIFILLVIFCIPVLWQIWRTLKDITMTLQTLNQSLPTILKNLEEITTNVNQSTAVVNRKIQSFSNMTGGSNFALKDIISNIQYFAPMAMKLPIFQAVKNMSAIVKGIRVFIGVLLKKEKV